MLNFDIHRFGCVDSTNRLAAAGKPGEVFVAEEQTAGRGRLDHRWHSRPGENLLMSVVLDVTGISPVEVATLPLIVGFTVVKAIEDLSRSFTPTLNCLLKWPNDVYVNSRKLCGILCERHDDNVVVGIGINVRQREFPDELRMKATSLVNEGIGASVDDVMNGVLRSLDEVYDSWLRGGFAALHSEFDKIDFLKGREVSVVQTDDDLVPVHGICGGIASDGSLLVGETRIYAGEVRW